MFMPSDAVGEKFLEFAVKRMRMSEKDILRCTELLTEEQMWMRGGDHENSVANLLLHLAGNMRQWILHGVDGQPDVRVRDEEFTLVPSTTSAQARATFTAAFDESCKVLVELSPGRLLEVIDPQPGGTWRHLTILEAIFQVVGHVQMHAGQIIVLTKQMTEKDLDLTMPRKR
jgi:uncharacterized damage-inducible protein DinB